MGQARNRRQSVGECIYCGSIENLSDEHIIPYALDGNLVIKRASCAACARITSQIEMRLLRGHWWPYRRQLRLQSRTFSAQPNQFSATLKRADGSDLPIRVSADEYPCVIILDLDPPSILSGTHRRDRPCAARAGLKWLAPIPTTVLSGGIAIQVGPNDRVEFPVNLDATDFVQFLAKIALGYAVSRRGLNALREIFVRDIILGNGNGALTYVGGDASATATNTLPAHGLHGLAERVRGDLLSVYIQLFRTAGSPMPIYEVVVGRLR